MSRATTLILPCLLAAALAAPAAAPPPDDPPSPAPAAATKPTRPRVIVRVNRREERPGYVELEDGDVIVVRHVDGEVRSYSKARLLRILRLVDPEPRQRGTLRLRNGQVSRGVIISDGFQAV